MVLLECRDGKAHWFTDLETGSELKTEYRKGYGNREDRYLVVHSDVDGDARLSPDFPTREAAAAYLCAVVRTLAERVTVVFLEEVAEFDGGEAAHE